MLKTFGSAIISMRCHVTPCCLNITYGTRSALLSWVLYQRHRTSVQVRGTFEYLWCCQGLRHATWCVRSQQEQRSVQLAVITLCYVPSASIRTCDCHLAGGGKSAGAVQSIQTTDRGCGCSCTPQSTLVHHNPIYACTSIYATICSCQH